MTSKNQSYNEAFVWIWLPGEASPVVAGRLAQDGPSLVFNYGQSYLERESGIAIYDKELPLQRGVLPLLKGLNIPGPIRDSAPDAWGRRVLLNKRYGSKSSEMDPGSLSELTYLLESGSDRIGALDFQESPKEYKPRGMENVSLEELVTSAELVEKGTPLPPDLEIALYHGSAIGGARPKALVDDADKKYIAKFSSSSDTYSVIKAEFIAMKLASLCGLNAARVTQVKAAHRDVLLIERFDRILSPGGWQRKCMISALSLLALDENIARYASYQDFVEVIRKHFDHSSSTLRELFSRLVFNVLVGNTDDHARNHAAFWDGKILSLTPAYDICPQMRTDNIANQAMIIKDGNKKSQIKSCLEAADVFMLSRQEALEIIERILMGITTNWKQVCDEAEVSIVDKNIFMNRQFLNQYAFEGLSGEAAHFEKLVMDFKKGKTPGLGGDRPGVRG